MGRLRILGAITISALAIGAIAASSASALPEIERCVEEPGGKYTESNCNAKVLKGGSFELTRELPKPGFTGANFGFNTTLEIESGLRIDCTAATQTGEWDAESSKTGPLPVKEATNVVWVWHGCEQTAFKRNCQNKGGTTGEIVFNSLEGPLGYLSKGKKEAGLELKPQVKKGTFATFECEIFGTILLGEGTGKLGDCIISAFASTAADKMLSEATEFYSSIVGAEGLEQDPQHFEGKTTHCNLETKFGEGGWEKAVLREEQTLSFDEALEIRA